MPSNLKILVRTILADYALPWDGDHGVDHLARVLENGLRLAALARRSSPTIRIASEKCSPTFL